MKMLNVTQIVKLTINFISLILLILPVNYARSQEKKIDTTYQALIISDNFRNLPDLNSLKQTVKRKRALLVGISEYQLKTRKEEQWSLLESSAKNDVELMAGVLINNLQFAPDDIKIISDTPVEINSKIIPPLIPTHKTIVDTFRSFLIEQAKPGDVVFFYFAGHGSQVKDVFPIDELDGKDETLVPWDYISVEDGSNDIHDDEINDLLMDLEQVKPSNVTMAIDSCYSGTMTRGDYDTSRGGLRKNLVIPPGKIRGIDESINDLQSRNSGKTRELPSNFFFFSAASPGEKAQPNGKNGAFTLALAEAIRKSDGQTTYRDIYERVLFLMNGFAQHPQIEGDPNRIFLEEGALPAENYFPVQAVKLGAKTQELKLLAGALQGMTVGSRFELYPPNAKFRQDGKPLLTAKIKSVLTNSSLLEVEDKVNSEILGDSFRAFEISHNYESILKIALKDTGNVAGLEDMLKNLGLAKTVPETEPEWNVLIRSVTQFDRAEKIVPENFKGVILQRRNAKAILNTILESPGMVENIRQTLVTEAKRIKLISLDNKNPALKIEIRLIPVEIDWKKDKENRTIINKVIGDKKEGLQYSKGGLVKFNLDDWYRIEVRNTSRENINLYITILNLDSKSKISSPFPKKNSDDNLVGRAENPTDKNNGWRRIEDRYIRIVEPYGVEGLWVIATREKTNFSPLFDQGIIDRGTTRGTTFRNELLAEIERLKSDLTRGVDASEKLAAAINSPAGQILIATQDGIGVKGISAVMPSPSWTTTTINYMVIQKR